MANWLNKVDVKDIFDDAHSDEFSDATVAGTTISNRLVEASKSLKFPPGTPKEIREEFLNDLIDISDQLAIAPDAEEVDYQLERLYDLGDSTFRDGSKFLWLSTVI